MSVSIPFGAYEYSMYECGKLSIFMHTPSPTIWKCVEIWENQGTSESKSHNIETALEVSSVHDPICFVVDKVTSGEIGSAMTLDMCYPLNDFEKMGCSKPMLEHIYQYSNLLDDKFDGTYFLDFIGLSEGISPEKFDECFDNISQFRFSLHLQKLLHSHNIEYLPESLVVTGGPVFRGDPMCRAVIDIDDVTRWFTVDSISNPQTMNVMSENPNPCKVNTTSCFCNAQMEITALTLEKLSYFTIEEEKNMLLS